MLPNTQQLLSLMEQLRDPERGCPWDVKQDFASLIPYLIEEAYEVIDAIERNDIEDLRLELGDLLLQVVFHAQIANERGQFGFEDVAAGISDKLVRRHPHVFADAVFASDEERQLAWDRIKQEERNEKFLEEEFVSVLTGVPLGLPALMACEKTLKKAASHGFDWPDVEPVFDKVQEEIEEVKEAYEENDQAHIEEEVGDLLLVVVNLARHLNVNPELALKAATHKFSRRFEYIEKQVAESGRVLLDCELEELDGFWNEAKEKLRRDY